MRIEICACGDQTAGANKRFASGLGKSQARNFETANTEGSNSQVQTEVT